MRYVLAIVALAISGVLLLLGIGQRTFLAGPSEIVYSIAAEQSAPYAVLDVSELAKVEGQANVVMRGDAAFSALANTRDAAAWLEPFDHVKLTIDPATKSIVSSPVRGVAPTIEMLELDDDGNAIPIDPRGSDLWLDERSGDEGVSRMAVEAAGEQSIIIAGAGAEPIPKGAALVWVQDRATPWAGPLLAAGGLFAALGAALYLIAFDRDKRALGPRRGRSGPLLGVRNVFGGTRKRSQAGAKTGSALKRGSHDNAPELAAGAAAGAAAASASAATADGLSAANVTDEAEEVVAAEIVTEGSTPPDADASDVELEHADPVDVAAEATAAEDTGAEAAELTHDEPVDAELIGDADGADDADADADAADVADAAADSDGVASAAGETAEPAEDEAATKGDDHAE